MNRLHHIKSKMSLSQSLIQCYDYSTKVTFYYSCVSGCEVYPIYCHGCMQKENGREGGNKTMIQGGEKMLKDCDGINLAEK